MKRPKINECPCCGMVLVTVDETIMGVGTVQPNSKCMLGDEGELITHILSWSCNVCGCTWKHGQFEQENQ